GIRQLTGSPIPDAVAAILIGAILGWVALELARRNGDFLIGRRAPKAIEADIRKQILRQPGVTAVTELVVTFLGPKQLRVLARVDIDDRLTGSEVRMLVVDVEKALCGSSPYIERVDVVPGGWRDGPPPKPSAA